MFEKKPSSGSENNFSGLKIAWNFLNHEKNTERNNLLG